MKSLRLKSEILNKDYRIHHFVDDPIINAYFKAKESILKYIVIKTAGAKRDYHDELFDVLNNYIEQSSKDGGEETLKNSVFHSVYKKKSTSTKRNIKSVNELAKIINPDGFSLLNLNEPLTHDSLRLAYRKAAMIHHPDKGGKVSDMQIINTSYQQFNSVLNEETYFSNVENENLIGYYEKYIEKAKSLDDFYFVVASILYEAYFDEWAIDKAYFWHKKLEQKTPPKEYIDFISFSSGKGSYGNISLLMRCFVSGLLDDNLICEEFTKAIKHEYQHITTNCKDKSTIPDGLLSLDFIKEYIYSEDASGSGYGISYYLDVVCGVIKYKPCLTHYRQLVNAKRLGFINNVSLRKHLKENKLNGSNKKRNISKLE